VTEDRPFGDLLAYPLRSGVTVAASSRGAGIKMLNMGELFRYPQIPAVEMARVEINVGNPDRVLLQPGDLMFARRSLTLEGAGKCSIVKEIDEATTWESSIIRARLDRRLAHAPYYFYFFRSSIGRRTVEAIVEQVAAAGIRLSELRNLRVPVPGLAEQRAIADVLGAFDDKIATNIRLVSTSDELASALTRTSLDLRETVALSEISLITMGSSPPGASYNEAGDGTVFYQGVRDFGIRYPHNRVWTTMPVRIAQQNDCLLSVRAPVGELNIAGEVTCIGRGLASVRSTMNAPMSLFHRLKDLPEIWAPYEAEGTVFGSINKLQLESLRLHAVHTDRRRDLEIELEALEFRIAGALEENNILAAMRDALLPQLMSGKIRVKDAEKTVEEVL